MDCVDTVMDLARVSQITTFWIQGYYNVCLFVFRFVRLFVFRFVRLFGGAGGGGGGGCGCGGGVCVLGGGGGVSCVRLGFKTACTSLLIQSLSQFYCFDSCENIY